MLADFLTVIPHRASMVLITSRPEYEGALTRVHGAQTIALAPLADSDTAALIGELLGSDPSVGELAAVIAESPANRPVRSVADLRDSFSAARQRIPSGIGTGSHPCAAYNGSILR